MRQQHSCTSCHAVTPNVNWVGGNPLNVMQEADGNEHPYCEQCLPIKMIYDYGTYVMRLPSGSLLCSAMLASGGWERENWSDLTAPESQEFLDEVNKKFGTSYRMEEFAGR